MSIEHKLALLSILWVSAGILITLFKAKEALMVLRLKELTMYRMKSKKYYEKGTVLHDEATDEYFKVVKCQRIDIMGDCNWGLTLEPVTIGNE